MFDLPLFPLNTVLFPGMPLPLHIFEERYKRLIRDCLETHQPFGVVLIRKGYEANGPLAEPHEIGCTARIVDIQPLSDGRINIITLGENRFRIHSLHYELPYLVGKVELYPFLAEDSDSLTLLTRQLTSSVQLYIQILNEMGVLKPDGLNLADDPVVLAYLAAVLLQVPVDQKQGFLGLERTSDLLKTLVQAYRRELALLRAQLAHGRSEDEAAVSLN
ncbi:MAG TPA: LON peptidase substrate-binding domain-containing protein [Anaerolineales bacterium]|nr:LON peptidase substrate-binding domain-containing protein [Anaerolineales bacterium]